MKTLWGGRFSGSIDETAKRLNDSLSFDWRLWRQDIRGSIAYATALELAGALTKEEARNIVTELENIGDDLESGDVQLDPGLEDIHTAIETLLKDRVGNLAGKLHTGRSRNDQVATDTRMYLRDEIAEIRKSVRAIQNVLVELSEREIETVMPGYTHMQHAQPVLLAQHLLAYFWMLERDHTRLVEIGKRVNIMPLGSGALAGSTVPLNRKQLAEKLEFDDVSPNSMDAVSDRDYIIEFLGAASILLMHLSRFAEEIVLWNSMEFGFIELDDAVTTGSSMMPQKKNPDVAELARAKPGRVYGHLMALLTVMKGMPMTYNKDLQEDKEGLFDTCDTLSMLLPAFEKMLTTIKFRRERMAKSMHGDFSTATDLADLLVKGGMPFREAHQLVGRLVRHCVESRTPLEKMTEAELSKFSPLLAKAPKAADAIQASINSRNIEGGTGREAVDEQLQKAKMLIWVSARKR